MRACMLLCLGLWTLLFIYSKFLELIDTAFIILRKKRLSFLHYYHHATVLLYTWDAYTCEQPAGIYFVAMNYTVHAAMYLYFFIAAVLERPLSWGIFVTVAQISQMFIGVGVTFVSMYIACTAPYKALWHRQQLDDALSYGHYITLKNLYWACLMYSTYFYLFAEYFVKRYLRKPQNNKHQQHQLQHPKEHQHEAAATTAEDETAAETAAAKKQQKDVYKRKQ